MSKMFFRKSLIVSYSLFVATGLVAQNNSDNILMTVGGSKITVEEFTNVYNKNNTAATQKDTKSIEEYVELFVNFKLKVREAEDMGLDTIDSFVNELAGYRKQLSQPYLTDKEVNKKLLEQTYERLKWEVDASHILVMCPLDALPKDTLAAYNRIMKVRKRIKNGEDFNKVASEKGVSEDESAVDNKGHLGYFTALQMVYSFETAAYTTPVGEVSMPIRTRFGYHIVKVHDKRKARGEVLVSHIMVKIAEKMTTEDSSAAKARIDELYTKLKAGEDFEKLAQQFSDDPSSSKKGGQLAWFGTGRMPIEFEMASFALLNKGDFCSPIKTAYGWHIIKLIDKKTLGTFDEMENELKAKVSKDSRSLVGRASLIEKVKKEYGFTEDMSAVSDFYKAIDSTFFSGKWSVDKAKGLNKKMFNLNDKVYTQQDFANYISVRQSKRDKMDSKMLVDLMYQQFVNESTVEYENSRLEQKYPEFRALMQEYRDGILLFELTDQKVWSKAIKDTAGSRAYYEKHKENYMWGERAEASIYNCVSTEVASQVRKLLKKKVADKEILNEINKDSQLNLKIVSKQFTKGENDLVDANWTVGLSKNIVTEDDTYVKLVKVTALLEPSPKSYNNSKGIVISDYQNYLEKEWVEELKNKYQVSINEEVLASIK